MGMIFNPADPETRKSCIADSGAFCAFSGNKTGRSPKDKRIVTDAVREKEIWWGEVNTKLDAKDFQILRDTAISYLNTRPKVFFLIIQLYVLDGYAGWDPKYRIKVRIVCTRAYHSLFMHNMLIRPTPEELETDFQSGADYVIFNAGEFHAAKNIPGISSDTSVALDFGTRTMVILGTQYAGEMKKGVFTIMNYLMPKQGLLPLHSSCNEGKDGDVTLFFGLSGTGKTALSADPNRKLIGDDEHVWG
jgi:phosphoenolpyruvate carboxykinase (ATP)